MAQLDRALRGPAARLLDAVLSDEQLCAYIVEQAIASRLASGELIERSSLTIGGLFLQPADTIATLEKAIDDALEALDAGDVDAAKAVLEQTIPEDHVDAEVPDSAPAPDAEAEEASDQDEGWDVPDEPTPAADQTQAPAGPAASSVPVASFEMPAKDGTYECERCGKPVPGPDAQISAVRFRDEETRRPMILCREDMKNVGRQAKAS